jgi:hypothetical protein
MLTTFVGGDGEATKLRAARQPRIYNQTRTSSPKPQGARRWLWCDLSSCSREERQDLLSNDVVVMGRVHLEGTVICPKINRGRDARYTALVDLSTISPVVTKQLQCEAYHLSRLCAANRELEIGILLPISKEQRELVEEAVVDVAHELDS